MCLKYFHCRRSETKMLLDRQMDRRTDRPSDKFMYSRFVATRNNKRPLNCQKENTKDGLSSDAFLVPR